MLLALTWSCWVIVDRSWGSWRYCLTTGSLTGDLVLHINENLRYHRVQTSKFFKFHAKYENPFASGLSIATEQTQHRQPFACADDAALPISPIVIPKDVQPSARITPSRMHHAVPILTMCWPDGPRSGMPFKVHSERQHQGTWYCFPFLATVKFSWSSSWSLKVMKSQAVITTLLPI